MNSTRSIALVGEERSGKATICRQLGNPEMVPLRAGRHPNRYRFEQCHGMHDYVLTCYRSLDNLNLLYSERSGLLVLTPRIVAGLQREHPQERHRILLEMIEKLARLGVNRYVLSVTHLEQIVEPRKWFDDATEKCKKKLGDWFGVSIIGVVPSRRHPDSDDLCNLSQRERDDPYFNWSDYPCLIDALKDLVRIESPLPQCTVATLRHHQNTECVLVPLHTAGRGFESGQDAHLYFGQQLPMKVTLRSTHDRAFVVDLVNNVNKVDSGQQVVLVGPSDPPLTAHLVLRAEFTLVSTEPSWKYIGNRLGPVEVTLFGEQILTPKDIDELPPRTAEDGIPTYPVNPLPRREIRAEIVLRANHLMDEYLHDQDLGRIILKYRRRDGSMAVLAAGRIVAFPDVELRRIVAELLLIDKERVQEAGGHADLFINDLWNPLHAFVRQVEFHFETMNDQDANRHQRRELWYQELKHDLLNRLKQLFKDLEDWEKDREDVPSSTAHKRTTVKNSLAAMLSQYVAKLAREASLIGRFITRTPVCPDKRMPQEVAQFRRRCTLLGNSMNYPVRNVVKYQAKKFQRSYEKWDIAVHESGSQDDHALQQKTDYLSVQWYPHTARTILDLEETISELYRNMGKIAAGERLVGDVFIDYPPLHSESPHIRIMVQDPGNFDSDKEQLMNDSLSGLAMVRREMLVTLPDKHYYGLNTAIRIDVPVWPCQPKFRHILLPEILWALNRIDYHSGQSKGTPSGLVEQFLVVMKEATDLEKTLTSFAKKLSELEATDSDQGKICLRGARHLVSSLLRPGPNDEPMETLLNPWETQSFLREADGQRCDPLGWLIDNYPSQGTTKVPLGYRFQNLYVAQRLKEALAFYLPALLERNGRAGTPYTLQKAYSSDGPFSEGTIKITLPEEAEWENSLRPLRTRLQHLSIKSFWQNECSEDSAISSVLHVKIPLMETHHEHII